MILAIASLTGEPFLDFLMQTGVSGLALYIMYRLMLKTMESKGSTQMLFNALKAFESIEKRLNHQDQHISRLHDTQVTILRLMERQLNMLEHSAQQEQRLADTLPAIRNDIAKLHQDIAKLREELRKVA